ncbi:MAG: 5-oxoprolinase subunit B/C family protein [Acidimicrobiales bacterium]
MTDLPGGVEAVGDAALRVAVADAAAGRRLGAAVRSAAPDGVVEVVPSFRSVLVVVDPLVAELEATAGELARLAGSPWPSDDLAGRPPVVLPVTFDGPDLEAACAHAGLDADGLVRSVLDATLTVAVVGFSPGFAYLEGLPPALRRIPRRATPRPAVRPGALGLAGGRAAVYPQATPGGWQLVGTTERRLFDPATPPFSLLQVGDTVRFSPAALATGAAAPSEAVSGPPAGAAAGPRGDRPAAVEVEDAGDLAIVQDGGRLGVAHLGVPAAGPADAPSHALANRLVGNADDAAAVEIVGRGATFRLRRPCYAAVVGPGPTLAVDGAAAAAGRVLALSAGQRLSIGRPASGLRSYVAFAGGIDLPPVMGSRATDTLCWIGPGRLAAGQELAVGDTPRVLGGYLAGGAAGPGTKSDGDGHEVLRVVVGPDAGWLERPAELFERVFAVAPASDRVGVRLHPVDGRPVARRAGDTDSEGMVAGAVQVPPDGCPVVLGPDHATLGGYPVAAVVVTADRWRLFECRPGQTVRLVPVDLATARRAHVAERRRLDALVVGHFPVTAG